MTIRPQFRLGSRKVLADTNFKTGDRLASLLKVVVSKSEIVARKAETLANELSILARR